jgi:hypothetical protein
VFIFNEINKKNLLHEFNKKSSDMEDFYMKAGFAWLALQLA